MGVGALSFGGGSWVSNPQTYQQIVSVLSQYLPRLAALGTTARALATFLINGFMKGGALSVAATSIVASLAGATLSTQIAHSLDLIIPGYLEAHMQSLRELGVDPNKPGELTQATINAALYAVANSEEFFQQVGNDLNDTYTSLGLTNYRDVGVRNIGDAFVRTGEAAEYFASQGLGYLTSLMSSSTATHTISLQEKEAALNSCRYILDSVNKNYCLDRNQLLELMSFLNSLINNPNPLKSNPTFANSLKNLLWQILQISKNKPNCIAPKDYLILKELFFSIFKNQVVYWLGTATLILSLGVGGYFLVSRNPDGTNSLTQVDEQGGPIDSQEQINAATVTSFLSGQPINLNCKSPDGDIFTCNVNGNGQVVNSNTGNVIPENYKLIFINNQGQSFEYRVDSEGKLTDQGGGQ
jgi:hypothetical protein